MSGKSFLNEEFKKLNNVVEVKREHSDEPQVHLTKYEIEGLKEMIDNLQSLAPNKRFVPDGIADPEGLLSEAIKVIKDHVKDDPKLAITGKPVACWSFERIEVKPEPMNFLQIKKQRKRKAPKAFKPPKVRNAGKRVRRVRCHQCENCKRENCR